MCYTIIYDENSGNLLHYVSVERKSLFFWPLGPGFCGGLEWGMGLVLKNHSLYITSLRYLSRVVYHTHTLYIYNYTIHSCRGRLHSDKEGRVSSIKHLQYNISPLSKPTNMAKRGSRVIKNTCTVYVCTLCIERGLFHCVLLGRGCGLYCGIFCPGFVDAATQDEGDGQHHNLLGREDVSVSVCACVRMCVCTCMTAKTIPMAPTTSW